MKLTPKQLALLARVNAGAEVVRCVYVKTTARGSSFSMRRVERYRFRINGKLGERLDPRTVESLARRKLVQVIQVGADDPLRRMMAAMAANEQEKRRK